MSVGKLPWFFEQGEWPWFFEQSNPTEGCDVKCQVRLLWGGDTAEGALVGGLRKLKFPQYEMKGKGHMLAAAAAAATSMVHVYEATPLK